MSERVVLLDGSAYELDEHQARAYRAMVREHMARDLERMKREGAEAESQHRFVVRTALTVLAVLFLALIALVWFG